jgi:ABC transport system ATP-binding/permease protein
MAEGNGRFVEFAGGYSDMVAQRGQGVVAKIAAPGRQPRAIKAAAGAKSATEKRRFSFKDKHALLELPRRIAGLETEIAALHAEISDGSLYARDPVRFAAISARLGAAHGELTALEDRWLELEMLRADIEGAT